MKVKNPLQGQVLRLLLVNTLACGLEACLAAGTLYIPPLLLAGTEEHSMTMALALSPILGLIFLPMIGLASDSWQGRFGRRRPFIWVLSLGVMLGIQIIPHARNLAALMFPQHPRWLDAVILTGAVCLLDICGQAGLTMLEALLSDKFPKEEENRRAFSVNSLMTSLGGCMGFLLPVVDWSQAPIATYLGGQEAFVCTLLTFLLLGCLITTVFIHEETTTGGGEKSDVTCKPLKSRRSRCCPILFLPGHCILIALCRCASACTSAFPRMYEAFARVPAVVWRLFVAETLNWTAMMSVMLFFGDYMGEGLYKGVPSAEPQSLEKRHYDEGVRMASLGLLLQYVVSMLCSTVLDCWVALLGSRVVYISGAALLIFATFVMSLTDSVMTVIVMEAVTGYSMCVFHVVPNTLMCLYHSDKQHFFTSSVPRPPQPCKDDEIKLIESTGPASLDSRGYTGGLTLPGPEPSVGSNHVSLSVGGGDGGDADCPADSERGMGFDMAILEGAYMLSQIFPALFLGSIVELADSVWAYMVSACCLSLLAFLISTKVVFCHNDLQR